MAIVTGNNSGANSNRGSSNYAPKTGLFQGQVVAINPDPAHISQLIGKDVTWNVNYLGHTTEGDRRVSMDIWLQDIVDKAFYRLKFMIVDKVRESANTPGNYQWVNNQGITIYGHDKTDIAGKTGKMFEMFRERPFRVAMIGEENLFDFLSMWVLQGKKATPNVILDPEMRRIFEGDFSELQQMIPTMNARQDKGLLTALATITEKDGKQFQNVWKHFGAGWWYDLILKGDNTGNIGRWLDEIKGPYGPKDKYDLHPLHPLQGQSQAQQPSNILPY